jgi:hypothetical protein
MDTDTILRTFVVYLGLPTGIAGFAVALYQIQKLRLEIEELKRKAAEAKAEVDMKAKLATETEARAAANTKAEVGITVKLSPEQIEKYGKKGNLWEELRHARGKGELHGELFLVREALSLLTWLKPIRVVEGLAIPASAATRLRFAEMAFQVGALSLSLCLLYLLKQFSFISFPASGQEIGIVLIALVSVFASSAFLIAGIDRGLRSGTTDANDA